jgi:hypothetical protein
MALRRLCPIGKRLVRSRCGSNDIDMVVTGTVRPPRDLPVGPRPSAVLVCPETRRHVDLVHSVAIPVGFAEKRAMLAFEVDPGDVKPEFFGVTAERSGDGVAHCDPGRQTDVVIGATGAGHDPTAAFGEHSRATWYDRVDVIGLRGGRRTGRACLRSGMSLANDATEWNVMPPSRPSSNEPAHCP